MATSMASTENCDTTALVLNMKLHKLLVTEDLSGAVALVAKSLNLQGHTPCSTQLQKFGSNYIELIMQLSKKLALICGIDKWVQSEKCKLGIFDCPKCCGVLSVPVTASCGHTFCKTCLSAIRVSETCFKCGQMIDLSEKNTNIMIQTMLEKLYPEQVEAMKLRLCGNEKMLQGKFDEAKKLYSSAIAIDPNDHRLFGNRAYTNLLLKEYIDSSNDADKAIALCYQWPKGHLRKCDALHALGENISALQELLLCIYFYKTIPTDMEKMLLNLIIQCFTKDVGTGVAFDQILDDIIMKDLVPLQMNHCNKKADQRIDVEKLEPVDIECILCFRLLHEPVTVPCGHMFCKQCINRNLDHRPSCPLCKASLEKYLSDTLFKQQSTTELVVQFLEKFFPSEFAERKQAAEDEIDELNRLNRIYMYSYCKIGVAVQA